MGTRFDCPSRRNAFDCGRRRNAFDVRGRLASTPAWEIDHDFGVAIYPVFMVTVGTSIYIAMSDNSVVKRASDGTYSTISAAGILSMAGNTIPCLGNDDGTLIVDSQHRRSQYDPAYDRVYHLADDGTLTTENNDYLHAGYAGLVNNGTRLFWMRDMAWFPEPYDAWHYSKCAYRNGGTWVKEDNPAPGVDFYCPSFIDQRFQSAIPDNAHYYTGDGDTLTQNHYGAGTIPQTHNMGVFDSKLYGCNGDSNLYELSSYAGGWSNADTDVDDVFVGCYGYGSALYLSGTGAEGHDIYAYDGESFVLDSRLEIAGRTSGYHRFVMSGDSVFMCAYNRILTKQVA